MNKYLTISNGLLFVLFFLTNTNVQAKLTFATYNIRNFGAKNSITDKRELQKILEELKADFITVEEIVNAHSFRTFIEKHFPHYGVSLSKCGGRGRQKIGFIYAKKKFKLKQSYEDPRLGQFKFQKITPRCNSLRPALIGVFTELSLQKDFVAIGVHLKAGDNTRSRRIRAKQYKEIVSIVDEYKHAGYQNIIALGDFNSTGFLDRDEDYIRFKAMLNDTNMSTSSQDLECTTYWRGQNRSDGKEEPSLLDHIIYTDSILGLEASKVRALAHCKLARCESASPEQLGQSYRYVSDHCPVAITFERL